MGQISQEACSDRFLSRSCSSHEWHVAGSRRAPRGANAQRGISVSLIGAAERFAAMDRSAIVFDGARCLHSLDRNSACEACFALCPADAITVGKPPVLD